MPSTLFPPTVSAVIALFAAPAARAEWFRVVAGPVDRIAASSTHVAAVRGNQVWLFADDGTPVGKLAATHTDTMTAQRGDHAAQVAEEILDRHDVSVVDRDSDWALELIDDERTLGQRREADSARMTVVPADDVGRPKVAAGEHTLWIAAGRTTWRVDAHGHPSRIALGPSHGALAASAAGLLRATGNGLGVLDGDAAPMRSIVVPPPVRHAALSASGTRMAWSSGTTVEWLAANERRSFPSPSTVSQLVFCGETLVALLGDSIMRVPPDGAPATFASEPRVRRWFCSVDRARPWLAVGRELLVSVDQGQRWTIVAVPAGAIVNDAAATARHVWLATTAGLFVSAAGGASDGAASLPTAPAGRLRKAKGAWLSWLPTVSVQAMTRVTAGKREVEAVALAQIPLEPRRLPVLRAGLDEVAAAPTPVAALGTHASVEPRDPDRGCLVPARRKAVELALAEPARAESYVARAGHAAWLPELRVLVSRRYGRSESLDLATSSSALSSPLGIDTVNDIRYEARATWDLGKLVFSTEELAAQNQALHMAELRRDIENTVNRLYFERQRLARAPGGAEPWARQLRVREIEAELDALSAGAFGACIDPKP